MTEVHPIRSDERIDLHPINVAGEPGVGRLPAAALVELSEKGTTLVAVEGGEILGFVIGIEPGVDYQSPNYRWFETHRDVLFGEAGFVYVDRIAVAPSARNRGIGSALYEAIVESFCGKRAAVCCEVNLLPPNPGSLRFHQRLGFSEVGRQVFVADEKAVCYLSRPLD